MPLTVLTTIVGSIVLFICWLVIGKRMQRKPQAATLQIRLLHSFFLHMTVFFVIMFLPTLWLVFEPQAFPVIMGWGYLIGHVFLYSALTYVIKLQFSLVPRLASKQKWATVIGLFAGTFITTINLVTLLDGRLPLFNDAHNQIILNPDPLVGICIAVFAALAVFPAALLMLVNGFRQPASRIRSFLLGGGLFLMMAAGPMHDTARSDALYAVADIVSVLALVIITAGVLYRYEQAPAWTASKTVSAR